MKKKRMRSFLGLSAGAAMTAWLVWGNISLQVEHYIITVAKIPDALSGYRSVHVSDLHNATIGKENRRLLDAIRDAEPDIIVVTGDLGDSRRTDMEVAFDFVREAGNIAPWLYVS